MPTSAADARIVIAVEKLLRDGVVMFSEQVGGQFFVKLSLPAVTMRLGAFNASEIGEEFSGWGPTFTEAFNDAYRQLPERLAAVAA